MPAVDLWNLENRLGRFNSECININLQEGTGLHSEITRMLKRRDEITKLKCIAAF